MKSEDEWLWGWDRTPGIVSVAAESSGRAVVWRRVGGRLLREEVRFRPWLLLGSLDSLQHLGQRLIAENGAPDAHYPSGIVSYRELDGPGELRYLVRCDDGRALESSLLAGSARRFGRAVPHLRALPEPSLLLAPEEQYLVASGRCYFRDLDFSDLVRVQFDLETTGLDAECDRIFLIALRGPDDRVELLEADGRTDQSERALIERFQKSLRALDPDVIENHNLHGFDLPFLVRRSERLGVPLALGRDAREAPRRRAAMRGHTLASNEPFAGQSRPRYRFTIRGRELIDTMDAVLRHDFSARDLPGHGLKAVARHFGITREGREQIRGDRVFSVFQGDPERVRRYAADDVREAAALAALLGGAAFALAKMAPRRYERLADAGPATGVLDPLLVRAYVRSGAALPVHEPGDGTAHSGARLELFATGIAERVVKADVASLYPSLMREYRIGPRRDRLGVLLALVDRLVEQRLAAKARARAAPAESQARYLDEALSAAMKIIVNSAYGYLGAVGLTRFADVHAANEVTRRGRELLDFLCSELHGRGVILLEADTDGVYFSVPEGFTEAEERELVRSVAELLPRQVHLEFDGRYAAMLSHEPKNYALWSYGGELTLRGVAFRSSRAEPFGQRFLRAALRCLLERDMPGVRRAYVETVDALRKRSLPTSDVAATVRLTKTPEQYLALRPRRRELPYEALMGAGIESWQLGARIRVYRAHGGRAGLHKDSSADAPRDYDVDYYLRVLRDTFASRLARAFRKDDFEALFADPEQPMLFARSYAQIAPILTVIGGATGHVRHTPAGTTSGRPTTGPSCE